MSLMLGLAHHAAFTTYSIATVRTVIEVQKAHVVGRPDLAAETSGECCKRLCSVISLTMANVQPDHWSF